MIEADDRQKARLHDLQHQNAHADQEETREELSLLCHRWWPPSRTRRALWHIDCRCCDVSSRERALEVDRTKTDDFESADWRNVEAFDPFLRSNNPQDRMSALGQKRTSRHLQSMSALPPKADIGTQSWNVRFVPKADTPRARETVAHFSTAPPLSAQSLKPPRL